MIFNLDSLMGGRGIRPWKIVVPIASRACDGWKIPEVFGIRWGRWVRRSCHRACSYQRGYGAVGTCSPYGTFTSAHVILSVVPLARGRSV